MFYRGKNILVLEGARMFGRTLLTKLLEQGAHVRTTIDPSREMDIQHKNLEIINWDPIQPENSEALFQDIQIAFLTSNKTAGAKVIKEAPHRLFLDNIRLQPKLMALAVKQGVERVGFMSSSYIYPDTGKANVEAEGFLGNPPPVSYGIGWCYRYLETLCKHFQMTSKTQFAIVRPAAYYGPYDNFNLEEAFVIPSLILKALNKMNPFEVWGNGEDVRCFTYVDDLMDGLLLAVEKHAIAEGINVCPEETHTVKQIVAMICEILDFKPQIRFSTDKPSVAPYKVSSPAMAKKILGWESRIQIREGLKRTIDWYINKRTGVVPA